jgi:hypothetical protein
MIGLAPTVARIATTLAIAAPWFALKGLAPKPATAPICPWAPLAAYQQARPPEFFSPDPATVTSWFARPDGPERLFQAYQQARVARLPDAVERERVGKTKFFEEGKDDEDQTVQGFDGYGFGGDEPEVDLRIPDRYQGTLISFALRAHELEHVIQPEDPNGRIPPPPRDYREMFDRAVREYVIEKHAMRAEWEFLRAVPGADRQKMVDRLRADAQLDAMSRDQVVRNLTDCTLNLDEYLRREHAAGRYSPAETLRKQLEIARERNADPQRAHTQLLMTPSLHAAIEHDLAENPVLSPAERQAFLAQLPPIAGVGP